MNNLFPLIANWYDKAKIIAQQNLEQIPLATVWIGLGGVLIVVLATIILKRYKGLRIKKNSAKDCEDTRNTQPYDNQVLLYNNDLDMEDRVVSNNKKIQILLQQKKIYESQYTELIDRETELESLGVGDNKSVKQIKKLLSQFATRWRLFILKKIIKKETSLVSVITHTIFLSWPFRKLLLPVWRKLSIPAKIIFVIIIGYVLWWAVKYSSLFLSQNNYAIHVNLALLIAAVYIFSLPFLFLAEKRIISKKVHKLIDEHVNRFKDIRIIHRPEELFEKGNFFQAMTVSTNTRSDVFEPQRVLLVNAKEELSSTPYINFIEIIVGNRGVAFFALKNDNVPNSCLWYAQDNSFMKLYADLLEGYLVKSEQELADLQVLVGSVSGVEMEFINIEQRLAQLKKLLANVNKMLEVWRDVCIADSAFDFIIRRINLFNLQDRSVPSGILLYGITGNGKEFLGKIISKSLLIEYVAVDLTALKSADDVKTFWSRYRRKRGALLYVNHAEQIFPAPNSAAADANSKNIVHAWVDEWKKQSAADSRIWVILSTDDPKNIHPLVLREIGVSQLEITSPDIEGRKLIIDAAIAEYGLHGDVPPFVFKITAGSTILELRELVAEVKRRTLMDEVPVEIWREIWSDVRGDDKGLRQSEKKWENLVLPEQMKNRLMNLSNVLINADKFKEQGVEAPKGILLYGPPGTGKTEIARTIANESGLFFVAVSTTDIKGQFVGESGAKVRALFSKARAKAPSILFIDEIESVVPDRTGNSGDAYTADITNQLLVEMDGVRSTDKPIFVLAATNIPESIDKAILSRFNEKLEISLPAERERGEILRIITQSRIKQQNFDMAAMTSCVARILKGASGRDLKNFINSVFEKEAIRAETPENIEFTEEKFIQAAEKFFDKASNRDKSKTWDRLILPSKVKERLKSICNILYNAHEFSSTGVEMPKGMLLYGPPGTGKTEIARTLANESGLYFKAVSTADLKAGYLGQSVGKVAEVFAKSRENSPSILFIDEIDAVAPDREKNQSEMTVEIINQLLQEIDGANPNDKIVFVLAATNFPETVDKAILSRLNTQIEIPLPDQKGRAAIISVLLGEKLKGITWEVGPTATELAKILLGESGRDLKNFINGVVELEAMRAGSPSMINLTPELFISEAINKMDSKISRDKTKTWENLILPSDVKNRLKQISALFGQTEKLLQTGIELPKGMLLYGPPGTGKTEIARTLANESGMQFIAATTMEIKGTHLGQSAVNVTKIFSKARDNSPCIIFLDELEALAAKRGGEFSDQYTGEIVSQLLQEIDGIRSNKDKPVFVLGATNVPEAIDQAILSRFSDKIEVPLPDKDGRRDILKVLIAQKITNPQFKVDNAAEKLASLFERKSGRYLNQFVTKVVENEVMRTGATGRLSITLETLLEAAQPRGKEIPESELNEIWKSVVLPDEIKASILGKLRLFNAADPAAPKGLLLFGPSGTGKTEIARKMAISASSHFMSLSISDLKAGYVGQSGQKVRKIWDEARSHCRCVMFVDECEGVFGRRGSTNSDGFNEEIVQAFLAEWDGVDSGGQIWVVGATNRVELLDEAIMSRFGAQIEINLPDAEARSEIIQLELIKLARSWTLPDFVSRKTVGFSGRKLATLVKDLAAIVGKDEPIDDVWESTIQKLSSSSSDAVDQNAGWHSLVLPGDLEEKLHTICQMLNHTETLANQGIDPPRGMILYGPPGTGKTQIARTIANESRLTFMSASTADIKAGYVGQSGQKVAELFNRARSNAPAILFIDEIEAVARTRSAPGADAFTQEIVTQLLQELDGTKKQKGHVFLLAATNMINYVDPAVLSRLPEKIEVPLPGRDQRTQIVRYFLSKLKYIDFDLDQCAERLADKYNGCSGRDIRSHIEIAQQSAVKRALALNKPERIEIQWDDFVGVSVIASN